MKVINEGFIRGEDIYIYESGEVMCMRGGAAVEYTSQPGTDTTIQFFSTVRC